MIIFAILGFCLMYTLTDYCQQPYTYDIAICAIFKNEARFMREWIEFHKLVGVKHFYLYNNQSNDNFKEILAPYIECHEIELFDWPFERQKGAWDTVVQCNAYNNALNRIRGIAKWVAFIDLDEFLFPVAVDNLSQFLIDYENYGGVCVNWAMFGTSNIEVIPDNGLMIEYLTMGGILDHEHNKHVKSIVRPERTEKFISPHYARYNKEFFQVTPDKVQFEGAFSPFPSHSKVRINHYYTRDIKWLMEKKMMDTISFLAKDHEYAKQFQVIEWCTAAAKNFSIRKDEAILKYVKELKKALNVTTNFMNQTKG